PPVAASPAARRALGECQAEAEGGRRRGVGIEGRPVPGARAGGVDVDLPPLSPAAEERVAADVPLAGPDAGRVEAGERGFHLRLRVALDRAAGVVRDDRALQTDPGALELERRADVAGDRG